VKPAALLVFTVLYSKGRTADGRRADFAVGSVKLWGSEWQQRGGDGWWRIPSAPINCQSICWPRRNVSSRSIFVHHEKSILVAETCEMHLIESKTATNLKDIIHLCQYPSNDVVLLYSLQKPQASLSMVHCTWMFLPNLLALDWILYVVTVTPKPKPFFRQSHEYFVCKFILDKLWRTC
jgi:hypothetical protein